MAVDFAELRQIAWRLRRHSIEMTHKARSADVGSSSTRMVRAWQAMPRAVLCPVSKSQPAHSVMACLSRRAWRWRQT